MTVTATLVGSSTRTVATTVTLTLSGHVRLNPDDYAVTTALGSVTIAEGAKSSGYGDTDPYACE